MTIDPSDLAHLTRIAADCGAPGALRRREIPLLLAMMASSEDVMALTDGLHGDRTWLVALTDRRIVLLSRPAFGKPRQIEVDIADVLRITPTRGWLHGAIDIETRKGAIRIEDVPKKSADCFSAAVTRVAKARTASNPSKTETISPEHRVAMQMIDLIV